MKSILYWELPSSVDVEGFLKKYPPAFKYKIDHFYYIVDYISRGMDIENIDDNAGFVNTNAQRLQKVIHNYKKYLEHLMKHRFIRTDMNYAPGKKSKGYLLNKYSGLQPSLKKIPITDFVMYKHKRREINEQKAVIAETKRQYPHLTKWFDGLQIKREKALKEVKVILPIKTSGIRGVAKRKASNWAKRYRAVQAINKIANGQFYYNIDDNVGRFHSNITNLKKELRKFITYNGQQLVDVDIKNSQPLLSSLLLNTDFYSHNSLCNITTIPGYQFLLSNTYHSYTTTTIMLVKTLKKSGNQDINTYIECVNSGSFYDKIFNMLYPDESFEKDKVKTMIFMILYSKNTYMGQPKAEPKKRFKKMFPQTYKVFRILKLCDHTALSRILQRIESDIMIQRVVPRIAHERPHLPIFTIHDSVVTTLGNKGYVALVIKEEIKKYTGLDAKIGIEYWQ